ASGPRDRGFTTHAEHANNQLGAGSEGLRSYTGTFAQEDLYEVAKNGDPEKGSWVVPKERAEGLNETDFVRAPDPITGEAVAVVHDRGSFVFRLAGRERQQSASFYTPEVLTRFVVSQGLDELLDRDGQTTSAADILQFTICEPALGSGAFAIEAVRQLAEEYLRRRQTETGRTIDADEYPRELQRVKAFLALNQTYGVDLNSTAVELAEISLWLDTMVDDLEAPWFGLRLRRGNSLVGARNAGYGRERVNDRSWLTRAPVSRRSGAEVPGVVPHFLLPAATWGATAGVAGDVASFAENVADELKRWRKDITNKIERKQLDRLVSLGHRVDRLWEFASGRLRIAARQTRRDIALWGSESDEGGGEPGV
ncbi:MAG: class I SAM-dependent DNA methyltransferase, partial [Herbiconiux sp.]|nr:class I SAM-dependent DNA methyltransferase [Herbiconiux sp.]